MRELLSVIYVQKEATKQNEAIINLQPYIYIYTNNLIQPERGKQSKLERCKNDGDWEPKKK